MTLGERIEDVFLIDSEMLPCYAGTSIEVRGEDEIAVEVRGTFNISCLCDNTTSDAFAPIGMKAKNNTIKAALEIERGKFLIFKERNS